MKHILRFILMFSVATAMAATENIRIMTFNIPYWGIKETDGNGKNTWENRAMALHDYFNTIHPDFIGTQETIRDQLCSILKGTPGYAMVGSEKKGSAEGDEYNAIVYRTDRFYVEHYGDYWLSATPDVPSRVEGSTYNRVATWALMRDKKTGARFFVTNTHLSYESPAVKNEQIRYLKMYMKEVQDKYGSSLPHLLTGDFNMLRTEEENYTYVQNYQIVMNDVWMKARKKSQLNDNQYFIDYIYATKNVYCTYAEWGKKETEDGYIMSDHDPVWADLYFTTSNEDNARAAISEAWALLDSTCTVSNTRTKLVTSASQLSADALEAGYDNLSYVLDGKANTFVHSAWSTAVPNNPHYLQARLTRDATDFRFVYQRREDTIGNADRWQDVMVTASNDGETWDYITELHDFGAEPLKAYSSDNISLHRPYRYIRFSVMRTPEMKLRNGHPQYTVSEFQMYANTHSSDSERYAYPALDEACTDLESLIGEVETAIAEGTAKKSHVTALHDAIESVRTARQDAADGISDIEDGKMNIEDGEVYDLAGRKVSKSSIFNLQPSIYISGGRKIIIR